MLRGDPIRQEFGVVPHAPDEARTPASLPGEPQEIDARLDRHAALMLWLTAGVEDVELEPAVIDGISGRPDDRRDAGFRQVQLADRIGQTCRIGSDLPGLGLRRKIEAVVVDVSVGLVQ